MEDNCFTLLCWFLPYINMSHPQVYVSPLLLEYCNNNNIDNNNIIIIIHPSHPIPPLRLSQSFMGQIWVVGCRLANLLCRSGCSIHIHLFNRYVYRSIYPFIYAGSLLQSTDYYEYTFFNILIALPF